MTPEQVESVNKHDDLTLEVCRESGVNGLNRYVQNPQTGEVLYVAEADEDHKVTIYKGSRTGPIIATATPCLTQDGQTDIHFVAPRESITLQHKHSLLPFFHGKTLFEKEGKRFHWSGQTALVEEGNGTFLAGFHARFFESKEHTLGSLVITRDGGEFLDLVVITCLVMQERSDEGKLATERLRGALVGRGGVIF